MSVYPGFPLGLRTVHHSRFPPPRSSNRTCGFAASGYRKRSHAYPCEGRLEARLRGIRPNLVCR